MPYRKSLYLGGGPVYNAVSNTGYNNQVIFRRGDDYDYFVSLIRRTLRRFPDVHIVAFCLLSDSYYILLKEDTRGEVASFMHSLGISYGIYFNTRYEKSGKVFQGPYKDSPIKRDDDTIRALVRLHALPSTEGHDSTSYRWSSYRHYLSGTGAWLEKEVVERYFAGKPFTDDLQRITSAHSKKQTAN